MGKQRRGELLTDTVGKMRIVVGIAVARSVAMQFLACICVCSRALFWKILVPKNYGTYDRSLANGTREARDPSALILDA